MGLSAAAIKQGLDAVAATEPGVTKVEANPRALIFPAVERNSRRDEVESLISDSP